MSRPDPRTRALAVADYHQTRDTYAAVAARHGVSRAALHAWVNPKKREPRGPKSWTEAEIALEGGRWVLDPVARIQRWWRA